MVLGRPPLSRSLLLGAWLALAAGCGVKHAPLVQAPNVVRTSLAAVMETPDEQHVEGVPDALLAELQAVAKARNLEATPVPAETFQAVFSQKRATGQRLVRLAQMAPDAELLLLVETQPVFFSQLSGRYRWSVGVQVTLAPREHLEEALTSEFQVPVFLEHYHEREAKALEAAVPIIDRHLNYLLDEYIGGLGDASLPGPRKVAIHAVSDSVDPG